MEAIKENKMAVSSVKSLLWKMGLPMIVSMILQALYNVVDSVFVANIPAIGVLTDEALTFFVSIGFLVFSLKKINNLSD